MSEGAIGTACIIEAHEECEFIDCRCPHHFRPRAGCGCGVCEDLRERGWTPE
jgi:hypothetical protein